MFGTALALVSGAMSCHVVHEHAPNERRMLRLRAHPLRVALAGNPNVGKSVLQTFPGIVFLCDQTELAVERAVADTILVQLAEG